MIFITGTSQDNTSGQVIYQEVRKLEIKLEGESAQFADMMPKERKSQKILYFTTDASLYTSIEEKREEESFSSETEGAMVQVKMVQPDDRFYADLKARRSVEQRDFMSRLFLIEKELKPAGWKLSGNQKTLLGYPCQEATRTDGENQITAWFTPSIPVPAGPGEYLDLPGLVLAVDINNGKRTIHATSVELKPVGGELLVKPKGGKKVSEEEFRTVVEEKNKEMEQQYGGGGGIVIKIQQ